MKPLPIEAARADGDLRLDLLVAGAARVERGIEEGVDARLLVVLQERPGERGDEHERPRRARPPPACAGPRETPRPAAAAQAHGRAEVGLAGDQQREQADRRTGHRDVAQAQRPPAGTRRRSWPRTRRPRASRAPRAAAGSRRSAASAACPRSPARTSARRAAPPRRRRTAAWRGRPAGGNRWPRSRSRPRRQCRPAPAASGRGRACDPSGWPRRPSTTPTSASSTLAPSSTQSTL